MLPTNNDRIQKFSSTGNFIRKWGSYGSDDGQFGRVIGIIVDSSGNVFVAEHGNHGIQKILIYQGLQKVGTFGTMSMITSINQADPSAKN